MKELLIEMKTVATSMGWHEHAKGTKTRDIMDKVYGELNKSAPVAVKAKTKKKGK